MIQCAQIFGFLALADLADLMTFEIPIDMSEDIKRATVPFASKQCPSLL